MGQGRTGNVRVGRGCVQVAEAKPRTLQGFVWECPHCPKVIQCLNFNELASKADAHARSHQLDVRQMKWDARLHRYGVRVVHLDVLTLRCEECGTEFQPPHRSDGHLSKKFWRCPGPNRCNWDAEVLQRWSNVEREHNPEAQP